MNKVVLMGRLTYNPDIKYRPGEDAAAVAKYTIAVPRVYKKAGGAEADFIGCTAFDKQAEFAQKYLCRGIKIAVIGKIQTGSYTNKNGAKVYTTEVIVENQELVESKADNESIRNVNLPEDGFAEEPNMEDLPPFD